MTTKEQIVEAAKTGSFTVAQAQKLDVCRICGRREFIPPDSFVFNYGKEYAHQFCLDKEKNSDFTDTYIQNCLATESIISDNPLDRILHAAFGLVTEAGEFLDALKKHIYYGKPLDYENLDEEIGDTLWYISIYLSVRNKSFKEIMKANTRKLKARYPKKFTSKRAINRNLKAEMEALKEKGV